MPKHPLDPALSKIERADTHISHLKDALQTFFKHNPYRILPQLNDDQTEQVWTVAIADLPCQLDAIAADAIHNLRTPLDKMLAAGFPHPKLHTEKAKVGSLKFPGIVHKNELEGILAKLEKHLTKPVIEFLEASQPYNGGAGEALSIINQLDNRDKHRALLEPIKLGFSTLQVGSIRVRNGNLLRLGSAKGQHMIPVPEAREGAWNMHQPIEALRPTIQITPPMRTTHLAFTAPYDDMELFTTTVGAEVQADVKPAINVAFSESGFLEGEPVLYALEVMRKSVEATLTHFKTEFF
ncbi:MAG: hypothetical protein GXC70_01940 [Sphingomonadaceae bacterium]|nr:hypothetical protein [Sphingomonadaceae bacterium]